MNIDHHKIYQKLRSQNLLMPLDILLVGGTGAGKSSTVNAMAGRDIAKVGHGPSPETKKVSAYTLSDALHLHDSAGLGEGLYADEENAIDIRKALQRSCINNGSYFRVVDLVLVILDGSSRDLGTTTSLLIDPILKQIDPSRIIVAINQADMAMKGRGWDNVTNKPSDELMGFLQEKAISTKARLKESLGIDFSIPIFFSAEKKYNIDKLMGIIYEKIPSKNRLVNI